MRLQHHVIKMNTNTQTTQRKIKPTYRKVYHSDGTTSEMRGGMGRRDGINLRIVVREIDDSLRGWTRERMSHPNNEFAS